MKTTGLFTIHEFTIPVNDIKQEILLVPFGDVHKFAPNHSHEKWTEFLDTYRDNQNAYFIGMGDYTDLMSATERKAFQGGDFHDSTTQTIDTVVSGFVEQFSDDIEFMRGRLVGLIGGNHYYHYAHGETSDQQLCRLMGCKFLGCMTFVRLRFVHGNHSVVKDIWAHHGKGAARLLGGSLNRVQQMAESADADIFLMGHDHKGPIGFSPKMGLAQSMGNLAIVERKQFYGRTGSFLRGYVPEEISYVADGCMNPANLGTLELKFIPRSPGHETFKIDMKATI